MTIRTAFVTGASRGLGLATTTALMDRGYHVFAGVRTPKRFPYADADLCTPVCLDLLDEDSIQAAADTVLNRVHDLADGKLDALIHNAGITAYGAFEDTPVDVWQKMFRTNVFGPMLLTRLLLPNLRRRGGHIVVVSSEAAMHGFPLVGVYSASKAAVSRWAESLSHEVHHLNVRVTILEPGVHATDIATDYPQYRDDNGAYRDIYPPLDALTDIGRSLARSPTGFARTVVTILESQRPPARRVMGLEAWAINCASRLLPSRALAASIRTIVKVADKPVRLARR